MPPTLYIVPSPAANPDAEALARIAHGDLGALGELHDRYARDLFYFARRAAPEEDAEDVVHAVFERLVRTSACAAGGGGARAWLFEATARVLRGADLRLMSLAADPTDIASQEILVRSVKHALSIRFPHVAFRVVRLEDAGP